MVYAIVKMDFMKLIMNVLNVLKILKVIYKVDANVKKVIMVSIYIIIIKLNK